MAPKALSGWRAAAPAAEAGRGSRLPHLAAQGYRILARNFRCRSGEVDVVARDGDTTVFVEVKERRGSSHGDGHERVTFGKRRPHRAGGAALRGRAGPGESPLRFDVVSIDWGRDARCATTRTPSARGRARQWPACPPGLDGPAGRRAGASAPLPPIRSR